jgi:hypothetical protein
MHVLKTILICFILSLTFFSCGKNLPKTPTDALKEVRTAYERKDARRMLALCTKGTVESYMKAARELAKMDDNQREALFTRGAIPKKENTSAEDLMRHEIETTRAAQDDPLYGALTRTVLSISEKDSMAIIQTVEGVELRFVKEGSYWKFSPEGK